MAKMKSCRACGAMISANASTCPRCGTILSRTAVAPAGLVALFAIAVLYVLFQRYW
jgi:RNA polymerase subunit RPABC4/transcription elongation factor Spt4